MTDEGKRGTTLIESIICSLNCLMPGHWLATDHSSPWACSFPGSVVDAGFVGKGTEGEKDGVGYARTDGREKTVAIRGWGAGGIGWVAKGRGPVDASMAFLICERRGGEWQETRGTL